MHLNVETLEAHAFGQITEQVVHGRGGYDETVREAVMDRLWEVGEAVGRSTITRVVRDPEVGIPQIITINRPGKINDPVSQGV